jgi:hypothetical protein
VKRVYSAATLPDAHLVLGLLAQAGIEAKVFNENAQGGMGEIPFTHAWPEVWIVDERDAARARELVRQFERPQAPQGARRCVPCGEESPGNFQVCWHCGAEL